MVGIFEYAYSILYSNNWVLNLRSHTPTLIYVKLLIETPSALSCYHYIQLNQLMRRKLLIKLCIENINISKN